MADNNNIKVENSKIPAEDIKNPELCEAILKMQEDGSKENIDHMIDEVIKAKFILPALVKSIPRARTTNGQTVMENATQVQFRLLENNNKEKFFGIFTDVEEMYKWNGTEKAHKVVTDFDSISQMVMDPNSDVKGFVINAFGKSVVFPKPMVISIKQQKDFLQSEQNTLKPDSPIQIGEPKEYPIDLMAALINHFSTEPLVNAAYLRMLEQEGRQSLIVVVDFAGNLEQTFAAISEVAKPYLDDEIQLSMMPYSMDFAKNAVKGIDPFYKKDSNL